MVLHPTSVVVRDGHLFRVLCCWQQRTNIGPLFLLNLQKAETPKTPRYYPAEDVKPAKPVHRVRQNVS